MMVHPSGLGTGVIGVERIIVSIDVILRPPPPFAKVRRRFSLDVCG
jgi:hypothetical protein